MESTADEYPTLGEVEADQRMLAASFGTIAPDDISDLLPIILGGHPCAVREMKGIEEYVTGGGCSSDEDDATIGIAAAGSSIPDGPEEEPNCYAPLQDDPDEDEFGGFMEYDQTYASIEPIAFATERLPGSSEPADKGFSTPAEEPAASAEAKISAAIAPLTSGECAGQMTSRQPSYFIICYSEQICVIKEAMKKIKLKPRIGTDFMVDSLLRAKIRLGDELDVQSNS